MKLSDREWTVLGVLWDTGGAALVEAKGLVSIGKEGYPRLYRAALSREDCQAQARDVFLQNVYRGATGDLVAAFLKEKPISAQEREALRRLLDEMEV